MNEYWFLTYGFREAGKTEWYYTNIVTMLHPCQWLLHTMKKYGGRDEYRLIFFHEIDKYKYDLLDGEVG